MTTKRRAIIVGGGIAGPTLGLFLARAGVEAAVFEAYPRADDVGGGFQIAPNGLRVLAALGLAEPLLAAGQPSSDMVFENQRGRQIGFVHTSDAGPAVNVARARVHRVLRDEAERHGVGIHYEKRLTGVAAAGREVVATFADGSSEVGDFLVGADGVRSRVRACVMPRHAEPRDTGMIGIGGFCRKGAALPMDAAAAGRLTFRVGARHQMGWSRMSATQWGWWCHVHAPDAAERARILGEAPEELVARMRARYEGWLSPVPELIAATDGWLRTPIYDVPSLPTWRSGRVLLLGDAAHAMSPAGGQGASLALEDAMCFAGLAAREPSIEDAMARFETLRKDRAEKMVAQGYENDRRSLKTLSPFGAWMRDRIMMPMFSSFIERALNEVYTAPIPT